MRLENIIGKPVLDQNFFGRDAELADLQAITEREHVLLLAPRRVGKTSLLHALVKRVDRDGSAIGVYASVAPATNETQFVQAVLSAIYATKRGRKLKRGIVARGSSRSNGLPMCSRTTATSSNRTVAGDFAPACSVATG